MAASKTITLGSGKLYVVKATKGTDGYYTIPTTVVADANLLGYIKGGATLSYSVESYTAKDDLGICSKTILTEESATLTSGIMTWNAETLTKLVQTARADGVLTGDTKKIKIGGLSKADSAPYAIVFRHEDSADSTYVQVGLLGTSTGELEIAFTADEETVLDAEFTAQPGTDGEGTLILYEEGPLAADTDED